MLRTHLFVSERAARDNDQVYRDEVQRTHAQCVGQHRDRTTDNTVSSLQPSPTGKRNREMRLGENQIRHKRERVSPLICKIFLARIPDTLNIIIK